MNELEEVLSGHEDEIASKLNEILQSYNPPKPLYVSHIEITSNQPTTRRWVVVSGNDPKKVTLKWV
ncbi:hypothetical protein [Sulfuriflexus mobilis]|uniref:hypothetical protein n=1 Tax=Sulfuriflexus mobilis TaxID=1811807 RepID=UPI000F82FEE5|nr:hypothetical protein [Sulfuriflexus mobilis]